MRPVRWGEKSLCMAKTNNIDNTGKKKKESSTEMIQIQNAIRMEWDGEIEKMT